ncbi:MAG: HAMP domain-containing sensor histidine kinase [Bacteroidales bacterium]
MDLNENIVLTKRWLIYLIAALIIFGYLIDLGNAKYANSSIFPNIISIGINILAVGALVFGFMSTTNSYLVIIYTLVINILISTLINHGNVDFYEADILRSVLFFCLIMTISGFVSNKRNLLLIGSICFTWLFLILIFDRNKFLIDNAIILFLVIISFTIGLYVLHSLLENVTKTKNLLIRQLKEKSEELENSNKQLALEKAISDHQKSELEKLIETREKMFRTISHDIKNPLSSIIGFSELLEGRIQQHNYDKALEFNKIIHHSSSNLFNLLNNLLEWTKLQTSNIQVHPEWINTDVCIRESMDIFITAIELKQIKVEAYLLAGEKIFADKNMLKTVIRNFYSNAIKFTEKGGKITIRAGIENGIFDFSITDNGIGIEPVYIEMLLHSSGSYITIGTEGEKGTGFGLVLCKEFIQKHHGTISIESVPDSGSTFSFSIPVEYVNQ